MRIVVLVKQVPDSGSDRNLRSDDNTVDRASANNVINEMDEYAIEEALLVRDREGGEVTVLTVGPEEEVPRDAGPVDVQSHPVVDVLEVPPGRRAVLASAPDTEVCLRAAVADDEPAAGQEVALPRIRGAAGEHQRDRRYPKSITCPSSRHCYFLHTHSDD